MRNAATPAAVKQVAAGRVDRALTPASAGGHTGNGK
jgi:hypothetical protein